MEKQLFVKGGPTIAWIPLSRSLYLLFHRKTLFGWAALLVLAMVLLTWLGYLLTVTFLTESVAPLFGEAPPTLTIVDRIWHAAWATGRWLSLVVLKVVAFYLSFLLAYTLCTPGYAMLSAAAERVDAGKYRADAPMTLRRFFYDLWEGLKIALFGVIVTGIALIINFIPGVGQLAVLFLYTAYATLMFIDFPASRAGWPLRRKLGWLLRHRTPALRLGLLPALVSMVPLVNIFALALLFPLFTIHATLNFAAIEKQGSGEPHAD